MHCKSRLMRSVAIASLLASGAAYADGSVTGMNDIPGTLPTNIGAGFSDISGDGTTLSGIVRLDATSYRPYIFTLTGNTALAIPAGDGVGYATGISGNGSVVVGYSAVDPYSHSKALVWRNGALAQLSDLETRPDSLMTPRASLAYGVSGDGHVVVGTSVFVLSPGAGVYHAVRWVDDAAAQDLQGGGFNSSVAYGASSDGSVVIGYGNTASHAEEVFRWTASGGMAALGVLAAHEAPTARSRAYNVSADGSTIVGESVAAGATTGEAFRWTQGTGMAGLGYFVGGNFSYARGVNGDGTVVVGSADRPTELVPSINGVYGFRWTEATGLQYIGDWLAANGVSVGNSKFQSADGVDDSGNVIFGKGQINGATQQYIARVVADTGPTDPVDPPDPTDPAGPTDPTGPTTPGPGIGVIGLDDYMASLSSLSAPLAAGASMTALTMWGAHHRVLADNGIANGRCLWATGDLARRGADDRHQYLGEMGLCGDLGDFRLGAAVGWSAVEQGLAFGGRSRLDGYYLLGEADYSIPGTGLVASLTGYYGDWEADISRNYLNGVATDTSKGSTGANSWAIRARLDWLDALTFGSVSMSPYAAYTQTRGTVDGYFESGGGFPVAIDASSQTLMETRFGTSSKFALGKTTDLRVSGEWVHRFERNGPAVSGTILGGLGAFSAAGQAKAHDWARFGLDIDQRVAANAVASLSVHAAAGRSEDSSFSGSLGLRVGF